MLSQEDSRLLELESIIKELQVENNRLHKQSRLQKKEAEESNAIAAERLQQLQTELIHKEAETESYKHYLLAAQETLSQLKESHNDAMDHDCDSHGKVAEAIVENNAKGGESHGKAGHGGRRRSTGSSLLFGSKTFGASTVPAKKRFSLLRSRSSISETIDDTRVKQLHEELGRVVVQNIHLEKRIRELEIGDEEKAKQLKEQRIYTLERELSHAKRKIEGLSRQASVVRRS